MQRSDFIWQNSLAFCSCLGAWLFALVAVPANRLLAQTTTEPTAPTVLFDTWHSNTWIRHLPAPQQYNYHQLHSLARAARALEAMGWNCEPQVEPWTPAALQDVSLIVINLVSADRPGFLLSEIQALNDYLKSQMEGLTAKVFRTYNASSTLQQELNKFKLNGLSMEEKLEKYEEANKQVAILCNHQKTVGKKVV